MENNNKNSIVSLKICEKTLEGECSGDYILPDTVADIKRVLRVVPSVIPLGHRIEDGHVAFEGRACYSVLVVTEQDRPVCLNYEEHFEDRFAVDGLDGSENAAVRYDMGALSWHLANGRRIAIKLKVKTHIDVSRPIDLAPITDGLNAAELECDSVTLPSVTMYTATESGHASQEIELEGSMPQIGEIIECKGELNVNETKCSARNVTCRGEISLHLLYLSDRGEPVFAVRHIPFSLPVKLDAAHDGSQALAYGHCTELAYEIRPNGYGELRMLSVECGYELTVECAVTKDVTLVKDAYSTERGVGTEKREIEVVRLERGYVTNFSVNASALRSDIGAENAERAVDADVRVTVGEIRREKNRLIVEGEAEINAVTMRKGDDGPIEYTGHSFTSPLRCEIDGAFAPETRFRCVANVTNVRVRIDANSVYCDIEVALALFAMRPTVINVVANVTALKDDEPINDDGAVVLCYPSPDETLWDIAARYRVTCRELAEANFPGEPFETGMSASKKSRVLMIPTK